MKNIKNEVATSLGVKLKKDIGTKTLFQVAGYLQRIIIFGTYSDIMVNINNEILININQSIKENSSQIEFLEK